MSKAYDNAKELEYINYDSTNNRINFSLSISSNNAPVASQQVYDANTSNVGFFALPAGNTAQRPASPANGAIRFNTTTGGGEIYFGSSGWANFAGEPVITEVTPGTFNGTSGTAFNISGVRFNPDAQIFFVTSSGVSYLAASVSYYSGSLIVATTPRNFSIADEPLSVKLVQSSGTYIKSNVIDCGGVPNWITTAGNLGSIFGANTVNVYVSATDPDGNAISYSITSGTLPSGLSLTSANGLIQGLNPGVTTNTTYNFTITATDSVNNTDRAFNYIILNRPPVWNTAATLPVISDDNVSSYVANTTVNAYDPDGGSITYTLDSGSLPSGMTFVSANGALAGPVTPVDSNTTSTFTVTATDVGNLGNTRTFTITVQAPLPDAEFSNTVLLIHGNANTVIKDASSNNYPLAVVADARASNFSPYNTSWSTYFGSYSSDNHLTYAPGNTLAFGTGDFTIECWAYWDTDPGSIANPYIIDTRGGGGGWAFSWNWNGASGERFQLSWADAGGTNRQSTTQMPMMKWNHCAYVRSGTTGTIYLNGVSILSFTDSTNYSASISTAHLGKRYSGSQSNPGYLSDLRIVKGTAVYTSNFTPPTSKLTAITNTVLLTFQDNRFKDNSTANSGTGFAITVNGSPKITGFSPNAETDTANGSMYFDGSGDYVSLGTPYNFGSNNFTVEGWFYLTTLSGTQGLWGSSNGGGGQPKLQPYISSGNITLDLNGASVVAATASTYLQPNAWNHIAFCRGGTSTNQTAMFINGVRAAVGTVGSQTGITTNFTMGYNEAGVIAASYISNFRIVDGTDVYGYTNTTYTVPSAPLTAIPNTRLLTFQNRQPHNNHGFQDSSRNKYLNTRSGNATQGTFTPFSADPGKWSNYFNGSSSFRTVANPNLALGTGDLTVEFWLNTTLNSDNGLFGTTNEAAWNSNSWSFKYSGSALTLYNGNGGGDLWSISTGTLHDSTWRHIAIVRSSGVWQVFVGGVSKGTTAIQGTRSLGDNSWRFAVGCIEPSNADLKATGFISNFHLANTALYTSNFTPNTSPIVAGPNTRLLTCQSNYIKDNSTANSGSGWGITVGGTPSVNPHSPFAPNSVYSTANTGGSTYLDGSGDYVTIASGTDFNLGTSDFSMEYWYYLTAYGSYAPGIFCKRTGGVATGWAMLTSGIVCLVGGTWHDSWSTPYWVGSTTSTGFNNSTSTTIFGQWTHVLCTRQGTDARWFVNGRLLGYQSRSGAIDHQTGVPLAIGFGGATSEQPFTGYVSSGRINIGYVPTGYQTSSTTIGTQIFTPPTSPVTLTSQGSLANSVSLLMNFTDAAIIDSTGRNVIETVNEARVNTAASKFGGSSMYFNASSGTRLQIPSVSANPIFNMGTGDHTIEFWMNPLSSSSQGCMFDFRSSDTSGQGVGIFYSTSRNIFVYMQGNRISSSTLTNGTWYHVAVVRASNVYTLYVDGVSQGTWANSDAVAPPANRPYVGAVSDNSQVFDGLIQDVRVTKSARYLTTFPRPTKSFPNR